jgi:hypothetical protein
VIVANDGALLADWVQMPTGTSGVSSINGQTGAVTLGTGDLEETSGKLFYTAARAIASALAGFTAGAGTVSDSDSILQALQKVVGNAHSAVTAVTHGSNASTARPSGVTAVYWIGTVEPVNAVNGDLWMGGI